MSIQSPLLSTVYDVLGFWAKPATLLFFFFVITNIPKETGRLEWLGSLILSVLVTATLTVLFYYEGLDGWPASDGNASERPWSVFFELFPLPFCGLWYGDMLHNSDRKQEEDED